eukprot:scaffold10545_cov131-Isochrysis_galbana.AAC.1
MVCEMDHSHLFPISRATPRCYEMLHSCAVGWKTGDCGDVGLSAGELGSWSPAASRWTWRRAS